MSISQTLIFHFIIKELGMWKVSAWWMPHTLTLDHQSQQMRAILTFLNHYNEEGDQFLDQIVTGDDSFIHYWTSTSEQASMSQKLKHKKHCGNSTNNPL